MVKRALLPSLNPTGLGSAVAAIYAAVVMIANAVSRHGVINPQVIVAALAAVAFLFARSKVTPVADPRDGNGQPLTASATPAVPAETLHLPPFRAVPATRGGYPAGEMDVSEFPPPPPSMTVAPPQAETPSVPPAPPA